MSGEWDRRGGGNRLRNAWTPVDVIRVPMALGADREGVDRGASELDVALRDRLFCRGFPSILKRLNESLEISVEERGQASRVSTLYRNALHVDAIAAASRQLASVVGAAVLSGHLALVLGGDHAVSIGSLAGAALSRRLGVIWIDAHADINTPETSPSGHIHGMPLAFALGRGPEPLAGILAGNRLRLDDLVYIGLRDVDAGERELLRDSDALVFTMDRVDELGIDGVVESAIQRLTNNGVEHVHVSFDLDVLDPTIAPGTGTKVPGGMTFREAHRLLTLLRQSDLPVVSVDVVELNPQLDPSGHSTEIAAAITATILGETMI